jgi:hypothetical protein
MIDIVVLRVDYSTMIVLKQNSPATTCSDTKHKMAVSFLSIEIFLDCTISTVNSLLTVLDYYQNHTIDYTIAPSICAHHLTLPC